MGRQHVALAVLSRMRQLILSFRISGRSSFILKCIAHIFGNTASNKKFTPMQRMRHPPSIRSFSQPRHLPLLCFVHLPNWQGLSSAGLRKYCRKDNSRNLVSGFSLPALIRQQLARKSCFFPLSGSKPLATSKHRFSCWNDKMALLCYVEEEQCRSLQPYQYKKHKYGRFPAHRESSSSTLIISSSCHKDRQGS